MDSSTAVQAGPVTQGAAKRGWGIKEIITTVLFSVLMIVLMLGAGGLSMFSADFALVGSSAVACFVAAPVFMLMTMRVQRFGSTVFLSVLTAITFCLTGNYWYMVPFYLLMGVVVDLIMLKPAWRTSPWRIIAGWTVYSALYVGSSLIPVFMNLEAYLAEATAGRALDQSYADAYVMYFTSPEWIVAIVLITAAGGFLGGLLGKKLMKKHFAKTGAI